MTYRVIDHQINAILSTARDELRFDVSRDGVVHGLIDSRLDPAAFFGNVVDLRNLPRRIITEAKFDKFSFFEELVARFECFLVRDAAVGSMEIEDVDTVGTKFTERFVHTSFQSILRVLTRFVGEALGGQLQTTFFPTRFLGPGFLITRDVGSSSIDLVVALLLEIVKTFVVLIEGCDASAF